MLANARYLVPNGFTAISMLFGLGSVCCSVAGDHTTAAWMILWGVLLDKLDGTAARLFRATSRFGVQFDSFADFVVFGIAPAALVYSRLHEEPLYASGGYGPFLLGACGLFVVAVSARLARFNISEPPGGDSIFYGVPTTVVGAIFASFYLSWEARGVPLSWLVPFPFYLLVASALMVSNLRLPKLKVRRSLAFNVFQFTNVAAAYVLAPLRLLPEYLLAIGVLYVAVGLAWGFTHPVGSDANEVEEEFIEETA